jgi:hypothetical protein
MGSVRDPRVGRGSGPVGWLCWIDAICVGVPHVSTRWCSAGEWSRCRCTAGRRDVRRRTRRWRTSRCGRMWRFERRSAGPRRRLESWVRAVSRRVLEIAEVLDVVVGAVPSPPLPFDLGVTSSEAVGLGRAAPKLRAAAGHRGRCVGHHQGSVSASASVAPRRMRVVGPVSITWISFVCLHV